MNKTLSMITLLLLLSNIASASVTGESVIDYNFEFAKEIIKEKAILTGEQADLYIRTHPEKTVEDLRKDEEFRGIVLREVGKTGYTFVYDYENFKNTMHPKPTFEGLDYRSIKDEPGRERWWQLKLETEKGEDAEGTYLWKDPNGEVREKYQYTKIIPTRTADGKALALSASTYMDEFEKEQEERTLAKQYIKEKAQDVAKQLSIYLKSNPEKTLEELQQDEYFRSIAVQRVGTTGYTAATDYNTLIARFHISKTIENLNLSTLSETLPEFWNIMKQTKGGQEAEGFYNWKEPDGSIKEKYMYIAIVEEKTADRIGLSIAATTYIEEVQENIGIQKQLRQQYLLIEHYPYMLAGIIILLTLTAILLLHFNIITLKGNIPSILFFIFVIIITTGIATGTLLTMNNFKEENLQTFAKTEKLLLQNRVHEITAEFNNLEEHLQLLEEQVDSIEPTSEQTKELLKTYYRLSENIAYAAYRIDEQSIIRNMYPYDENALGANISYQEHMKEVTTTKKPVISGVFNAVEGFKGITIHNPVIEKNEYKGTVAYLLNLNEFFKGIASLEKKEDTPLFLLDQEHKIIYTTEKHLQFKNKAHEIEEYLDKETVHQIINKEKGYSFITFNGQQYLLQIQPIIIRGKTWHLIGLANTEELYSEIETITNTTITTTIIAILLIILLAVLLNYYQTKTLRKQVKEQTQQLKEQLQKLQDTKRAILNMMDDLQETNKKLKEVDKAKTEFLNIVSHELKTPLTALSAYTEILQEELKKPTTQEKESIEAIQRNAKNLQRQIGNILEIARMESGKFELLKTTFDLKELTEEVIKDLESIVKKKDITLQHTIKQKTTIQADRERIREVLTNLISNAIKFTEKGSITINTKEERENIIITVKDTGVGIPKDKIRNLFHKFYQVDASLSRRYGGTGLGLAITKRIVEEHKGTIQITSIEGKGTTFTITIKKKGGKEKK